MYNIVQKHYINDIYPQNIVFLLQIAKLLKNKIGGAINQVAKAFAQKRNAFSAI